MQWKKNNNVKSEPNVPKEENMDARDENYPSKSNVPPVPPNQKKSPVPPVPPAQNKSPVPAVPPFPKYRHKKVESHEKLPKHSEQENDQTSKNKEKMIDKGIAPIENKKKPNKIGGIINKFNVTNKNEEEKFVFKKKKDIAKHWDIETEKKKREII